MPAAKGLEPYLLVGKASIGVAVTSPAAAQRVNTVVARSFILVNETYDRLSSVVNGLKLGSDVEELVGKAVDGSRQVGQGCPRAAISRLHFLASPKAGSSRCTHGRKPLMDISKPSVSSSRVGSHDPLQNFE